MAALVYDFGKHYRANSLKLQLYCEHPGCFHPVEKGGLYTIKNPSAVGQHYWLPTSDASPASSNTSPQSSVPGSLLADADYAKLIKDDLTLTNNIVKTLPSISYTDDDRNFIDSRSSQARKRQTQRVSGSALRALHEFLKEKDKQKTWGHLSRVKTPEGDILWLCEHHKREFYPTSG